MKPKYYQTWVELLSIVVIHYLPSDPSVLTKFVSENFRVFIQVNHFYTVGAKQIASFSLSFCLVKEEWKQ